MKKFLIYTKRVQVADDHGMTVCCILTRDSFTWHKLLEDGQITTAVGIQKNDQL